MLPPPTAEGVLLMTLSAAFFRLTMTTEECSAIRHEARRSMSQPKGKVRLLHEVLPSMTVAAMGANGLLAAGCAVCSRRSECKKPLT